MSSSTTPADIWIDWIDHRDPRYQALIALMWKDLKWRGRLENIIKTLTTIHTYLETKAQAPATTSLAVVLLLPFLRPIYTQITALLATLPDNDALIKSPWSYLMIYSPYAQQRETVLQTHESLRRLLLQAHSVLRDHWIPTFAVVSMASTRVNPTPTEVDCWHQFCTLIASMFPDSTDSTQQAATQAAQSEQHISVAQARLLLRVAALESPWPHKFTRASDPLRSTPPATNMTALLRQMDEFNSFLCQNCLVPRYLSDVD